MASILPKTYWFLNNGMYSANHTPVHLHSSLYLVYISFSLIRTTLFESFLPISFTQKLRVPLSFPTIFAVETSSITNLRLDLVFWFLFFTIALPAVIEQNDCSHLRLYVCVFNVVFWLCVLNFLLHITHKLWIAPKCVVSWHKYTYSNEHVNERAARGWHANHRIDDPSVDHWRITCRQSDGSCTIGVGLRFRFFLLCFPLLETTPFLVSSSFSSHSFYFYLPQTKAYNFLLTILHLFYFSTPPSLSAKFEFFGFA